MRADFRRADRDVDRLGVVRQPLGLHRLCGPDRAAHRPGLCPVGRFGLALDLGTGMVVELKERCHDTPAFKQNAS